MQTDHRVPTTNTTAMRQQQYRKRTFSDLSSRKRDRHDLICVVCHAPAMGYNFDQITCESCKAFFRRNALNNSNKFKCRSGADDCVINLETRKRCKACRLKKCFDKGLRKEWIMSEEEKRSKKQKIEDNRRLRCMSQNLNMLSFTTSSSSPCVPETEDLNFLFEYQDNFINDDNANPHVSDDTNEANHSDYKILLDGQDRILLAKLEDNYNQAVRLNSSVLKSHDFPCLKKLHDVTDVVNEPAQIGALRMITFFKLTPEFNALHEDDRFALIKHNLLGVLYLHFCICTDTNTEIYHEPNTPSDFCYHASELSRYSNEVYRDTMIFTKEIQNTCSFDHFILKLAMLIMIFSKGSDLNEPNWLQPEEIFQAQNVYINLLWKYLDARFGSHQTASRFSRLIFSCMKAQILGRKTKEAVSKQNVSNDHLAPIMQSIISSS